MGEASLSASRVDPDTVRSLVIGALPVLAILVSSLRPPSLALLALRETVAIAVGTVVAALIPAARKPAPGPTPTPGSASSWSPVSGARRCHG